MIHGNLGDVFDLDGFDKQLAILKKIANQMCFEILAISAEATNDLSELERELNINDIKRNDE